MVLRPYLAVLPLTIREMSSPSRVKVCLLSRTYVIWRQSTMPLRRQQDSSQNNRGTPTTDVTGQRPRKSKPSMISAFGSSEDVTPSLTTTLLVPTCANPNDVTLRAIVRVFSSVPHAVSENVRCWSRPDVGLHPPAAATLQRYTIRLMGGVSPAGGITSTMSVVADVV